MDSCGKGHNRALSGFLGIYAKMGGRLFNSKQLCVCYLKCNSIFVDHLRNESCISRCIYAAQYHEFTHCNFGLHINFIGQLSNWTSGFEDPPVFPQGLLPVWDTEYWWMCFSLCFFFQLILMSLSCQIFTHNPWYNAAYGIKHEVTMGMLQWPLLLTWLNFNPSMDK